ncbi:sensor histidine kinase [Brevibacterium litoralis]|uniref:sensor histidine kinase n=1 Tax=Brevibacterium litoralis TaxID=3138935 RepID=UPI0032EB6053
MNTSVGTAPPLVVDLPPRPVTVPDRDHGGSARVQPGLPGVVNVVLSGVLGLFWLWIPLGLFVFGIGGLLALGSGIILLLAWFAVQRVVNHLERLRAEAIYGEGLLVPVEKPVSKTGAAGFLQRQWNAFTSAAFWRSAAHHYVKALYGLLVCVLVLTGLGIGADLLAAAINPMSAVSGGVAFSFGGEPEWFVNRIMDVALGVVVFASSGMLLWFSAYLDRGLDRGLLPPTRSGMLEKQVTRLDRARSGAVEAATAERLRIERDLHDGVQPMLVAVSMKLGMAKAKFDKDPAGAKQLLAEAHAESKSAITELRQLARGIHPAVLTDRGLDAAVSALAGRSPIPVDVTIDLPFRPGEETESVAYFVVAEALTNAAKHAQATRARVRVTGSQGPGPGGRGGSVQVSVSDDGRGGAVITRDGSHTGLAGLVDRVAAAGGTCTVTSPVGGPTIIVAEVPCGS